MKPKSQIKFLCTHQDAHQRGAGWRVFREADVVQRFAEDGPVVVLIDQLDENASEAHVVGHGLVGIKLERDDDSDVYWKD